MITKQDLQEAIAECEGQRNPNANTCIKLAAYQVILDHMEPHDSPVQIYSTRAGYNSGTEFSDAVSNMEIDQILPIIDELMEALMVINPRLYDSVLRKLRGRE